VLLLAALVAWGLFVPRPDPFVEAIRQAGLSGVAGELDAWYPSVPLRKMRPWSIRTRLPG